MADPGTDKRPKDFIREIIDEDNRTGKHDGRVHTRFPPEPNGLLHIGHAKHICLNFDIASEYGGLCNLRFDDTNPTTEEDEYVEAIKEDIRWLGYDWGDRLYFASDYFDQMYDHAVDLINKGKAYVDDQTAEEISSTRGDFETPGTPSPFRDRTAEENLDLFGRMKEGEFGNGEKVLRAKIDMAHPNMNMRDPVMYRIVHAPHHNTGDRWCIYPMYDWAHGLEDTIERITHSLCTLEFENHRPLYDWFLIELGTYRARQIEYARLNVSYTVLSKRWLKKLVDEGFVSGWDDPRMPTICGMRRRGYPPEGIKDFCNQVSVAKKDHVIALELLEHCIRGELNRTSPRYMGVLKPLKVIIENLPEDHQEEMEAVINPEDPEAGTRKVPFSRELYIERDDFMEDPPKKFYRLAPGREVRFRYAYLVTCTDVVKDDGGEVVELRCRVDPDSRGGNAPDGRKVRSTIHWVSAEHAADAEVRLYDKLFTVEDPMGGEGEFTDHLNPDSLEVVRARVDPIVRGLGIGERFQFERLGYFTVDRDTTDEKLVINRTVTLRDSWAKMQKTDQR